MELKQANEPDINYPSKHHIKPILLSVGVAMALSGCANNEVKTPSYPGGAMAGPLVGYETVNDQQTCKVPLKSEKKEVKEPELLGGVPPIQPLESKKN